MLSKDEDFKPPKEHETWVNGEFTNVLDYLSEKKVRFDGTVFIDWVAAPYISIWLARSTESQGKMIWVMHNMEFTDYIISEDIETSRDAIRSFANKWADSSIESLRCRKGHTEKLQQYIDLLLNVGNDGNLWDK